MEKIIKNLRNKPEHVRKNILYVLTFTITALIFLLWAFMLHQRLTAPEVKEAFKNDLAPLTVLKDNITATYQDISGDLKSIRK